jgi:hypothetical protein
MAGGGSKPGERRGGRKPGTPNKVTADVAALAREHTIDAINKLVAVMNDQAKPVAAQVMAANMILDRGHGKPRQALEHGGTDGGPIVIHLDEIDARA